MKRGITAAILVALAAAALLRRPSFDITVTNAHCLAKDGTRIVTFTAHNSASTPKTASVKITVYSEVPNGEATDPAVAGVKRVALALSAGETRRITEEVQGTRGPVRGLLVEQQRVDVRVLKAVDGGVQPGAGR
jgi:hypothetical protein